MKNIITFVVVAVIVIWWIVYTNIDYKIKDYQKQIADYEQRLDNLQTAWLELAEENQEMELLLDRWVSIVEEQLENQSLVCEYITTRVDCIDQWYDPYNCTEEYIFPIAKRSCNEWNNSI